MSTTTLADIHPDIIQTHILPRLDGPSLSSTAAASSHLKTLCSDDTLWSQISTSTWPSIAHPRVQHVISTFPAGHRSFVKDSFPALITDVSRRNPRRSWSTPKSDCDLDHLNRSIQTPSELISAVDIRYLNDVVYSRVNFTEITPDFLSSAFGIELNDDVHCPGSGSGSGSKQVVSRITRPIDLTVDEISGARKPTLTHLKKSVTLSWILIDPTRKRACNLSSIKPVSVRQDWLSNETHLRFVTVLPGSDPNEIVKCSIKVVLGVGEKGVGLYVKEVVLRLMDLDDVILNGREFLVITRGALLEEKNVKRKVVDEEERWRCYMGFKEMKSEKRKWEQKEDRKRELVIQLNYAAIFVSFFFCVYIFFLLL